MWYGMVWCDVVWCDVVWCGVMWCDVVWYGVMWCDVVWCGVMWCGTGHQELTSQQQKHNVSRGRMWVTTHTCRHTEVEAVDQTCHLSQSRHTDTRQTSNNADPIRPDVYKGNRLVGLVVKAFTSRATDPCLIPAFDVGISPDRVIPVT